MKLLRWLFIIHTLSICGQLHSQDMQWEWASFATNQDSYYGCRLVNISCNLKNEFYSSAPYDSLLVIGDTILYRPEFIHGENCAVIKFKNNGTFDQLIDLHTVPGCYIENTYSASDQHNNLYLACSFSRRIFFLDTLVNHCNTPFIDMPDGLITKIDEDNQIKWIRTIGGTSRDQIWNIHVDMNGNSYIMSEQHGSSFYPTVVSFFMQDTVYSNQSFTSLSKLDENGIMQWRVDLFGNISSPGFRMGLDGIMYLWGFANSDIIHKGDTVFKPDNSIYIEPYFIARIDENGEFISIEFHDFPANPLDLEVDESGNIYFSARVYDNYVIGSDTMHIPDNVYYGFIGKFGPLLNPMWYHIIPRGINHDIGLLNIELSEGKLFFATHTNRNIQIADTTLQLYPNSEAIIGIFNEDGSLEEITTSQTSVDIKIWDLILDNCNNPILAGRMRGEIYLHNDTVQTYSDLIMDGALFKVRRIYPGSIDIGDDTLVCNEHTITGPPNYLHYMLNDSIIGQNTCVVKETGFYIFSCTNDGCWLSDTIFVQIHPGLDFQIGTDTTIFSSDSITLSVGEQYDSVRWFNGVISNAIVIHGDDFIPGTHIIWANAYDGPCSSSDTISLTIISDFGINENDPIQLEFHPNPCHDALELAISPSFRKIFIYNIEGDIQYSSTPEITIDKLRINTSSFKSGIYLIRVITDKGTLTQKFIKQ